MATQPRLQDALFDAALSLPNEERAILADRLLGTVGPVDDVDEDLSPELRAELDRRVAALETGTMGTISLEEFMQKYGLAKR